MENRAMKKEQAASGGASGRYRTARIEDLETSREGQEIRMAGRISHIRDHGGVIFVHLSDGTGELQVRFNPETFEGLDLRREDWLSVKGPLELRPEGMENVVNPLIVLPAHELVAESFELLGRPKKGLEELPSLELPLSRREQEEAGDGEEKQQTASEEQLLRYRPFALRRNDLQRAIRARSRMALRVRSFLETQGFCEIETPILAAPTPEGARDFLVPSRLHRHAAYALPQSPQIYKQLLMVGGFDRYFQISRCFRDEDLRANRQPEFTQIDLEMSFVEEDDVLDLVTRMMEDLVAHLQPTVPTLDRPVRFSRMTYEEAMTKYGSDAPDLRIPYEIADLTEIFKASGFAIFRKFIDMQGAVLGVPIPAEGRLGRQEINRLREWAKSEKLPQPAWGDKENGEFVSTIGKYFSDEEKKALAERMDEGGQIFFAAAGTLGDAQSAAGKLRRELGRRSPAKDLDKLEFVWVTDFPAFERDDDGEIGPMHHPFTDVDLPEKLSDDRRDWLDISSRAYDLVLNGEELGSGSVRIHDPEKQLRVLEMLGYPEAKARRIFRHLLEGLEYGAPPHGGIALGVDRLLSNFLGVDSIRQTIAFPKDGRGRCLMTDSPSAIDTDAFRLLGLQVVESDDNA